MHVCESVYVYNEAFRGMGIDPGGGVLLYVSQLIAYPSQGK